MVEARAIGRWWWSEVVEFGDREEMVVWKREVAGEVVEDLSSRWRGVWP